MTATTRRLVARGLWTLELLLALALIVLSVLNLSAYADAGEASFNVVIAIMGLSYVTVGALIAARRGNILGWIFCWIGIGFTLGGLGEQYPLRATVTAPGSLPAPAAVATWQSFFGLGGAAICLIFLLFPDGRVPTPRWRMARWIVPAAGGLAAVAFALRPGPLNGHFNSFPGVHLTNPIGIPGAGPVLGWITSVGALIALVGAIFCIVSLVLRFRRSAGDERQQIRWVAYVGGAALFLFTLLFASGFLFDDGPLNDLVWVAFVLSLGLGIPAACLIAAMRYRLYELDIVVRKTVVFALVGAFITAVYVVVVVAVPTLAFGIGASTGLSPGAFVSAVIVALAFQPVRTRARRLADRIVYGGRATPYEVLSDFSGRLSDAYSVDDVLPRMAQILRSATGARWARVWLRVGRRLRPAAASPSDADLGAALELAGDDLPVFPEREEAFEVRHQGALLGALSVRMHANDPMDPAKERLVRDLASQAGLVLRNARLIEELRESRRRIVAAQDERAKALERNIHDGAQQQLVAMSVKLRLAQSLLGTDPERADAMLAELQADASEAVEDLRDLARGIYPPLLADKGLPAALEAQARKSPVPVTVRSNGAGRYEEEIEAAVYFCCLEALQNVGKYANASRVNVSLSAHDGCLTFEVTDDGDGFDPGTTPRGTGLQGMSDRIDAVGGSFEVETAPGRGVAVRGTVPAPPASPRPDARA